MFVKHPIAKLVLRVHDVSLAVDGKQKGQQVVRAWQQVHTAFIRPRRRFRV
jgi:hypothetical protein